MTVSSMTGFGAATAADGAEQVAVELRSVNGKFCEVKARLPRELAALESELVKFVKDRVARGNVELFVRRTTPGAVASPRVDAAALEVLARSLRDAATAAGLDARVSLADLVAVPGIVKVEEAAPDVEAAARACRAAIAGALARLFEARAREGAALEADLRGRIATMRALWSEVARLAPASVEAYRERLRMRIGELAKDLTIDPARLEQEVVLFADRTDVAEEVTRLEAHFAEFERLLSQPGPVGRQLDFLLQEMNREVNTTGSKSQSAALARLVIELKAELERVREQVQNVE